MEDNMKNSAEEIERDCRSVEEEDDGIRDITDL